ncbi:extracellular solute-binding protein [Paenibacillus antri]|uniref:Extracellular solute-binding protein n=1 Tax=Paenibacillus antri TaxID=2582848 RepID=A0A5R9GKN3_9BACL|nr:extracellular solute-binding protein [Paenibacillus antri]TLS54184.1 extracellular solute-binding protein [Paenibacillus antri]
MDNKVSRKTFRHRLGEMVSALREDIITGRRPPGDYLPSELTLAEQFSLSKNSVRQGLEQLVGESLIEKVPRVGNRVRDPNEAGTITVRFGYYASMLHETNLQEMLEGFYKLHPHIRVQMVPIYYSGFLETVPEYFENGLLDAVTINNHNYQHCLDGGRERIFEPMEENKELYPFLTRAFKRSGGELHVQPFVASPVVLCYNKEHFEERGVPEPDSSWTWDDLLSHSAALRDGRERYGFHFHLLSGNRWPIFLLQSGASFRRDDLGAPPPDFGDDRLWDGLELGRRLHYDPGTLPAFLSETDSDTESLFLQQKVSMMMTTYYSLNSLKAAGFRYDLAPLPAHRNAKTLLLSIGLAVNKASKAKDAAMALVRYLLSYDVQLGIRRGTLTIPSHKKAAEWQGKEAMYRPPHFHMYRDIVPTFAHIADLGLPLKELERMRNELKLYWSNMESREQAIERLRIAFERG